MTFQELNDLVQEFKLPPKTENRASNGSGGGMAFGNDTIAEDVEGEEDHFIMQS